MNVLRQVNQNQKLSWFNEEFKEIEKEDNDDDVLEKFDNNE